MKEQLQKMLHQTILIPCLTIFGRIAQSVEQRTENPCVAGSIPAPATTLLLVNKINALVKT